MENLQKYIDTHTKFEVTLKSGDVISNCRLQSVSGSYPIFTYKMGKNKFWIRNENVKNVQFVN